MKLIYNSYCYSNVLLEKGLNYMYQNEIKKYLETERIYGKNDGILLSLYNLTKPQTLIIKNIYLGNAFNARDYYNLIENKIGLVINCTLDINNYFCNKDNLKYYRVSILDNNQSSILKYLNETSDLIKDFISKEPDKKILIHCFMGSSRSATVLIAYLIKYQNYTRRDALSMIKSKRNIVNLNINFFNELGIFENMIRGI